LFVTMLGFDMAETDKLFNPLTTDQQTDGVGIGLDTVKKIIHRHRGRYGLREKLERERPSTSPLQSLEREGRVR